MVNNLELALTPSMFFFQAMLVVVAGDDVSCSAIDLLLSAGVGADSFGLFYKL